MELVFLCGRHCHRPPGPPAEFAGHLLSSEACGQEAGKSPRASAWDGSFSGGANCLW